MYPVSLNMYHNIPTLQEVFKNFYNQKMLTAEKFGGKGVKLIILVNDVGFFPKNSKTLKAEKQKIIQNFAAWDVEFTKNLVFISESPEENWIVYISACNLYLNYSLCSAADILPIIFHFCNRKNRDSALSNLCAFDRFSESIKILNPFHKKELHEFLDQFFRSDPKITEVETLNRKFPIIGDLPGYKDSIISKNEFNYKKNIQVHKVSKWIDSFCEDMKLRLSNMRNSRYVWKGEGLDYRLLATNKKYKELNFKEISQDFKRSKNILILLGFDGTLIRKNAETVVMINEGEIVKMIEQPSASLVKNLEYLAKDRRVHIFILTHHGVRDIDHWLGDKPGIGLVAETGFCFKMNQTPKDKWENLCDLDWSWTQMVAEIMGNYVKRKEGSYIETRKSGIQWKFNETGDKLNNLQEKALEEHLLTVLEPFDNVEVVSGHGYIEVKPYGMSKGAFAQLLIRYYSQFGEDIDLLLALGCASENEDLFSSIKTMQKQNTDY